LTSSPQIDFSHPVIVNLIVIKKTSNVNCQSQTETQDWMMMTSLHFFFLESMFLGFGEYFFIVICMFSFLTLIDTVSG
jgi:hypothetical protein